MIDAWSLSNMIAFSAQIAVIVTGGALIAALVPIDAPGVRYMYWRVLAGLCLVLPWLQAYQEVPALVVAEAGTATVAAVPGLGLEASAWSAAAEWTTAAGLLIAGGAAIRLAWLAAGLVRLRRLRRAGLLADAGEHTDLQQMLGTRAEIRVVLALDQPVTFGCIRPVILVPASLLQHPVAIQRAVLAHELLHVQRRDWAWLVGEEIVRAALWFHPAMARSSGARRGLHRRIRYRVASGTWRLSSRIRLPTPAAPSQCS